jgi:ABC-2 type transport system ATP-binding protein
MIHVENLTKYYNDLCAVDQINLDIQKGGITGLLGPNGAGKTTIMRMLTGFLSPTSGGIRVKEYNIRENSLEIKRLLGYLPESAPLYKDMIVYDYLNYVANIRTLNSKGKISTIRNLADLCGIREVMHRPINELSRGYRQRVGLAHAMMGDPEILVLDEPTSGLDPNQIVDIREIIRQIGKEKTVILSTHILSEAEATCDRVVIINKGKIVADGTMESLKESASLEYFIDISLKNADFKTVEKELVALDAIEGIVPAGEEGDILHVRLKCSSSHDPREEVYMKIKQTSWTLLEFKREIKSLENIFREITREN